MLRISWTEHVINVKVLRGIEKEYLGRIMRGPIYEILHLIIQGKRLVEVSSGLGICENGLMSRHLTNLAAASRIKIPNFRNGDGT
ncbi:hypothetical protein Trydic_g6072 [Trypoxylus dichotomus]